MAHSYVWHNWFICVTWLIHMCDMTHLYTWHDSFLYLTWLIHMCDMTHSHVWHDPFMYVTWLIHKCDMTHSHVTRLSSYVWRDSFVCVTWLIYIRDVNDMLICKRHIFHVMYIFEPCHSWIQLMRHVWHIDMCAMTQCHRQLHTSRASFIRVTCDILICVPWLTVLPGTPLCLLRGARLKKKRTRHSEVPRNIHSPPLAPPHTHPSHTHTHPSHTRAHPLHPHTHP